MLRKPIRNGLRSGVTFSVIIIFLALTGFTVTAAGLIARLFGAPPQAGQTPAAFLVIFLALIGIWNGAQAARPDPAKVILSDALTASLVAGLVAGALSAILALIYGSLLAGDVDPRPYLSQVSPDSMQLFLFNQGAAAGALAHVVLMAASALAGGALAFYTRKLALARRLKGALSNAAGRAGRVSVIEWIRRSPYAIYMVYALVAALLFFLPRQWGSYWNYIIGTVGIYVIMGLGLNIIVGLAGQLVLGYVAFFAIGAYTAALLTAPQPHALNWNFWITLVIAILAAGLTGILLGLPILRLRGDYLAIVTLGFGEIIRIMLRSDLLTPFTAGPKGLRDIGGPTLFGRPFTSDVHYMYLITLAVLLMIFVTNRLQNSRAGRAWEAIREDEVAGRATGINTFQSKLLALAIGAAFAGLGGALFAARNQFTGPEDHTLMVSINVLALVIVGGMGSIPGIILGAFALKGLPEILRELENYRLLFFAALLVVMMILRPEGLWPARRPQLERTAAEKVPIQAAPGEKKIEAEGVQHATKS
jgi:branched-chain amino acid transport system permease protein